MRRDLVIVSTAGCLLMGCHSAHNLTSPYTLASWVASSMKYVCAIGLYLDLLTLRTDEVQTPNRAQILWLLHTPWSEDMQCKGLQHRFGDHRSWSQCQNTKQISFWGLYAHSHLIRSVGQKALSQTTPTCKALLSQKILPSSAWWQRQVQVLPPPLPRST